MNKSAAYCSCSPLCGCVFISFGSVLSREIADLLGSCMFNIILNCSNGCIIFLPTMFKNSSSSMSLPTFGYCYSATIFKLENSGLLGRNFIEIFKNSNILKY